MKNSELLNLQSEGEKICSALKLLSYNVSKDAHDHMRMLNRLMPASEFAIVFDIPPNFEQSY